MITIISAQVSLAPCSCLGSAKRSPDVVSSWQDYTFAGSGRFRHANCTEGLRVIGETEAGAQGESGIPECRASAYMEVN